MKYFFVFLCAFPVMVFSSGADDVHELRDRCEQEKAQVSQKRHATPSCELLEKALREQQSQKDRKNVPEKENITYQWNGMKGRFCYYNEAGEEMSCP